MSAAVAVAVLVAGGVFLVLQRGLVRLTLGFVLLSNAANVILLASGGMARRDPPLPGTAGAGDTADPLPQAFALTAIVISFGITVYLLSLARSDRDDDTEDDP
ncbi:sodium:proton antiporter [Glycomyces xiaoerkulensis]|uniref:sodium:proton antiporter n=1 Tax=Glycomyces xiaoerkulensis TaxID=2038139 RepID=UPI000C261524|nr:NADH-quinone oxidoreductase subunit K [Glycomyces xiaoerkulensis]